MTTINRFTADASVDDVSESVRTDGYAVVEGALDDATLARLRDELAPHLESVPGAQDDFLGYRTKRFSGLVARVPLVREILLHPIGHGVAKQVLGPSCARIQLNSAGVIQPGPGETAQTLHRDTGTYPIQNPCPPLVVAGIWAVDDFTVENGATCFVPGSHLWDDRRQPRPEDVVAAVMPAGSVFIYNAALLHGGGANRSSAPRTGINIQYGLGWLRPDENLYLSVPQDLARTLSPELQELIGYGLYSVNLNVVDQFAAIDLLNNVPASERRPVNPPELMAADNAIQRFHVDSTAAVGRSRYDVKAEQL